MDSLKGLFLIAHPKSVDANFAQTVIFMVEHNNNGAFGLVLSRPTSTTLDEICEHIFEDPLAEPFTASLKKYPLFTGGPVQKSAVFFLHTLEEIGKENIKPGLYIGNHSEELRILLDYLDKENPPKIRVFFGYSGWGAGQLENELKAGGWLIHQATLEHVFETECEDLWCSLVSSYGGDLGILGLMPRDPELN